MKDTQIRKDELKLDKEKKEYESCDIEWKGMSM